MTKKSKTKKIAYFLKLGGHEDKIEQMKADIFKCDSEIERDFVEDHYKQYFKKGKQYGKRS